MKRWYGNNQSQKCLNSGCQSQRHFLAIQPQIFKLVVCLLGISFVMSGNLAQIKAKIIASATPSTASKTDIQLDLIAAKITVKVLGADFLGSGIILQHRGDRYTVLTNQHVLRAGEKPYRIQAPDGKIYQAQIRLKATSQPYDLALLEFIAPNHTNYQTANIGNSVNLQVGEPIFAAGFPYESVRLDLTPHAPMLTGFTLNRGRIAIVLDKSLEEGYQIGYTNDVKKGMSGGPLLNSKGEVVGINGKHAYPLWDAPDFYADGSQPCSPLQDLITRSSLAIPIERGTELSRSFKSLPLKAEPTTSDDKSSSMTVNSESNPNSAELIAKMRAEAEATKKCRNAR